VYPGGKFASADIDIADCVVSDNGNRISTAGFATVSGTSPGTNLISGDVTGIVVTVSLTIQ
jgi:hypothetical protein